MPEPGGGANHPLDRAIWNALTTRRAALATGDGVARRLRPDVGLFVAAADTSSDSLAALDALVAPGEKVGMIEAGAWPIPSSFRPVNRTALVQMVAPDPMPPPGLTDIVTLTAADAPAMLDLATTTQPGPFFANTHLFGGFIGIKRNGVLIAMAGTRLALPGFVEVSAVCTLPQHRGQGIAAALIRAVAGAIQADGDTPFLTSYADNDGAIALYEKLGFARRRDLVFNMLERC